MSFKTFVKAEPIIDYEHRPEDFSTGRYMEDELYRKYFDETDFSHFFRAHARHTHLKNRQAKQERKLRARGKQIRIPFEQAETHFKNTKDRDFLLNYWKKTKKLNKKHSEDIGSDKWFNSVKMQFLGTKITDMLRGCKDKSILVLFEKYRYEPYFVSIVEKNSAFNLASMFFCNQYRGSLGKSEVQKKLETIAKNTETQAQKQIKKPPKGAEKPNINLKTSELKPEMIEAMRKKLQTARTTIETTRTTIETKKQKKERQKNEKKKEKLQQDAQKYFNDIHYGDKMAKTGTIFLNSTMIHKIINAEKNSPNLSAKTMGMLHSYSKTGMVLDFSSGNEFKTFKTDLGKIIRALREIPSETIGDKTKTKKTWSQRSKEFDQEAFQKGVLKIKKFEGNGATSAASMFKHKDFEPSESLGAANEARKKIGKRNLGINTYTWGFLYRVGLFFKMCWETLKAIVFAALFLLGVGMIIWAVVGICIAWVCSWVSVYTISYAPYIAELIGDAGTGIICLWEYMKPFIFGTVFKECTMWPEEDSSSSAKYNS